MLRLSVQLVDALNGRHLWADRFDRLAKDIFALQDEIVKNVIVELQVKLTQGDMARVASRGTDNLKAWLLRIEAGGEFFKFGRQGMTIFHIPQNSQVSSYFNFLNFNIDHCDKIHVVGPLLRIQSMSS